MLSFFAVVRPATAEGQKILSVLESFGKIPGVSIKVIALSNAIESEKLPNLRFYRFIFKHDVDFDENGHLAPESVVFKRLPQDVLLTMGLDVPEEWVIRPKDCDYDLDNIKLSTVTSGNALSALFSLEYLLIQGHAIDITKDTPPRGLQFVLKYKEKTHFDTITMDNLGYLVKFI